RDALDVAVTRDGDDHLLFRDKILFTNLVRLDCDYARLSLIAILVLEVFQLSLDDRKDLVYIREQVLKPGDPLDDVFVLVLYRLPLKGCKLPELHVEDGFSLDLRQPEAAHHLGPCDLSVP